MCAIIDYMKKSTKVVTEFAYMAMTYVAFEDEDQSKIPAIRRTMIFNDGTIVTRETAALTGKVENEVTLKADVYEVATVYSNIRDILSTDRFDKETLSAKTKTTDVQFEIVYSKYHRELCSPFLSDDRGISIMAVFDGLLSFVKKDHRYYNWYEVVFSEFDNHAYSYFYDDDSIKVGDKVIVPVGKNNTEKTATVVNFWRFAEENLPFPAEKTKKIIRKLRTFKPFDIDKFLRNTEFTEDTVFMLTDNNGYKNKCRILGDYRTDKNAKEPYLHCWLFGGIYADYTADRIRSIRKSKE